MILAQTNLIQCLQIECPICLLAYDAKNRKAQILPCSHNVCKECVGKLKDTLCPICRIDYNNKNKIIENLIVKKFDEKIKQVVSIIEKQKNNYKKKQGLLQSKIKEKDKSLKLCETKLEAAYSQIEKFKKQIEKLKKSRALENMHIKPISTEIRALKKDKSYDLLNISKTRLTQVSEQLQPIKEIEVEEINKNIKNRQSKSSIGLNKINNRNINTKLIKKEEIKNTQDNIKKSELTKQRSITTTPTGFLRKKMNSISGLIRLDQKNSTVSNRK